MAQRDRGKILEKYRNTEKKRMVSLIRQIPLYLVKAHKTHCSHRQIPMLYALQDTLRSSSRLKKSIFKVKFPNAGNRSLRLQKVWENPLRWQKVNGEDGN